MLLAHSLELEKDTTPTLPDVRSDVRSLLTKERERQPWDSARERGSYVIPTSSVKREILCFFYHTALKCLSDAVKLDAMLLI